MSFVLQMRQNLRKIKINILAKKDTQKFVMMFIENIIMGQNMKRDCQEDILMISCQYVNSEEKPGGTRKCRRVDQVKEAVQGKDEGGYRTKRGCDTGRPSSVMTWRVLLINLDYAAAQLRNSCTYIPVACHLLLGSVKHQASYGLGICNLYSTKQVNVAVASTRDWQNGALTRGHTKLRFLPVKMVFILK